MCSDKLQVQMMSFEKSDVCEYGPQHSTPVKGQENLLCKKCGRQSSRYISRLGQTASTDLQVDSRFDKYDDSALSQCMNPHSLPSAVVKELTDSDSVINISKISVIEDTPNSKFRFLDKDTLDSEQNDDDTGQVSPLNLKSEPKYSHNERQPLAHQKSDISSFLGQGIDSTLKCEDADDKNDICKQFHTGYCFSAALPCECNSDSDLSKLSMTSKANFQHMESSEMSFDGASLSPNTQRMVKIYHKLRSKSAPRSVDINVCNSREYQAPVLSISDIRRTPAIYIEQDIINKQRHEIQLLMEELGNRDQELNDLVMSHQKQVKAWESDTKKLATVQARLSQYEDELKIREEQLKETLSEIARVNEQREVDALELKRTQDEMMKLAERIMENSLYIKEMETQNQKLSISLKEFVSTRQAFMVREQELLSVIKEKDCLLADKQQEIDKLTEDIKYLEFQCDELGEKNNNTTMESTNWKKKYLQVRNETDKLSVECKAKEENIQKMTQQLHESLQQAIALQKALFTSCEREKCKEEVMYSLRKQHKRTMQELQNIRELYDRLNRDTTLYHLSVKDKEVTKEERRKVEEAVETKTKRSKTDEGEKRRQDSRKRHDMNMSSHKLKSTEAGDKSFLVKEMKENKVQVEKSAHVKSSGKTGTSGRNEEKTSGRNEEKTSGRNEEKNTAKSGEKFIVRSREKSTGRSEERNKDSREKADVLEVVGSIPQFENMSQLASQKLTQSTVSTVLKNEQPTQACTKGGHTTMCRNVATTTSSTSLFSDGTSFPRSRSGFMKKMYHTESSYAQIPSVDLGNVSKNADHRTSRSLSHSRSCIVSGKYTRSRTTSPMMTHMVSHHQDRSTNSSVTERVKEKGGDDSSSGASHTGSPSRFDDELTPADSDGMCHELKRDISQISSDHFNRLSQVLEASGMEPKTSSCSMVVPKNSSFLRKVRREKTISCTADEGTASASKHFRKRAVDFDHNEELTRSVSMETQSQSLGTESECQSPQINVRRNSLSARDGSVSHPKNQTQHKSEYQNKSLSPEKKGERSAITKLKSPFDKNNPPSKGCMQDRGKSVQAENWLQQKQIFNREDCQRPRFDSANVKSKAQNAVEFVSYVSANTCSECRAENKATCDCSKGPKSCPAFPEKAVNDHKPDISRCGVAMSHRGGINTASANMSFNEINSLLDYNSSLSKSQNHHLQAVGRGKQTLSGLKNEDTSYRHSNQKMIFRDQKNKQNHNQNIAPSRTYKTSDLPLRSSTYVIKHSTGRRGMYYNNNSKSVDHSLDIDLNSSYQIPNKGSQTAGQYEHESSQNRKQGRDCKYSSTTNKGECHGDSALLDSSIDTTNNSQNSVEICPQKQTHTLTKKRENNFKDATNNNSRESHKHSNISTSSDAQDDDSRLDERCYLYKCADDSSEVNERLMFERTGNIGHCGYLSKKLGINRKDLKNQCYFCPEESDLDCLSERNSNVKHLFVKGKEDQTCILAASSCTSEMVPSSLSSREPSLYMHLSKIHFSEKTRRYEWTTQSDVASVNGKSEMMPRDASRGRMSSNQNSIRCRFSEVENHATCGIFQDSRNEKSGTISDLCQGRLDSQISDSGHFSNSGGSSGLISHKTAPEGHSSIRSSSSNSKSDRPESPSPARIEISEKRPTAVNIMDMKQCQDLGNKNNSNYPDDQYLGNSYCVASEVFSKIPISHVPVQDIDYVVKRLDFSNLTFDGSKADSLGHEITDHCCWGRGGSDENKNLVSDSSKSSADSIHIAESVADTTIETVGAQDNVLYESQISNASIQQEFLAKKERHFSLEKAITKDSMKIYKSLDISNEDEVACDNVAVTTNNDCLDLPEFHFRCFRDSSNRQIHSVDEGEVEVFNDVKARFFNTGKEQPNLNGINLTSCENTGVIPCDSIICSVHRKHKESNDCYQQSLYNRDTPLQAGGSYNILVRKTFDPGTLLSAEERQQKQRGSDSSLPCTQHSDLDILHQPESCLQSTQDISSDDFMTVHTWDIPAQMFKNSLEEITGKFDDPLSSFIQDSTDKVDDESYMGTSASPMSRLHKLLVESQELIQSLQKSSAPQTVRSEVSLSSSH